MKVEAKLFLFMVVFFAIVAPAYAYTGWHFYGAVEPIGTTVLVLTLLMSAMVWAMYFLTGRKLDLRYEDNKEAEIVQGAGALGFFPPSSIWPFWCALVIAIIFLGPIFGWWISIFGAGLGIWAVMGWCYEFYVGAYKH